ncbi:sarcosine oxidase subunit delta [Rhodococcus globerulus]|uniref:sarcosine oxidase subunit delta n=1 Tax=Rhodococcus globerulus TaxID=33008 RepID=UPI000AAAFEB9|nr:sarcosine oxidase subunit delta [Rhodococcus globerulus]PVX59590.1 sarcosine oxidase delta subunit [Rhodococcus globerulus]
MIVTCPVCGPREDTEFSYAGELASDEHQEHWRHTFGCTLSLAVRRDLVDDRLLDVKIL